MRMIMTTSLISAKRVVVKWTVPSSSIGWFILTNINCHYHHYQSSKLTIFANTFKTINRFSLSNDRLPDELLESKPVWTFGTEAKWGVHVLQHVIPGDHNLMHIRRYGLKEYQQGPFPFSNITMYNCIVIYTHISE